MHSSCCVFCNLHCTCSLLTDIVLPPLAGDIIPAPVQPHPHAVLVLHDVVGLPSLPVGVGVVNQGSVLQPGKLPFVKEVLASYPCSTLRSKIEENILNILIFDCCKKPSQLDTSIICIQIVELVIK